MKPTFHWFWIIYSPQFMYFMCDSVRLKCSVRVQVLSCIEKQWILGKIAFNFKNTEYFETFNKKWRFLKGFDPKKSVGASRDLGETCLGVTPQNSHATHLHHTPHVKQRKWETPHVKYEFFKFKTFQILQNLLHNTIIRDGSWHTVN